MCRVSLPRTPSRVWVPTALYFPVPEVLELRAFWEQAWEEGTAAPSHPPQPFHLLTFP